MATYCLTFGEKFRREPHPTFPEAHPDGWVEVDADDIAEATSIGLRLFGNDWARVYTRSGISERHFPRGCVGVVAMVVKPT